MQRNWEEGVKMGCPHTTFYRGKKVRVCLKDGTDFIDKYQSTNRRCITFKEHIVQRDFIKSITIYKEQNHDRS